MENIFITISDINSGLKGYMKYSLNYDVENYFKELSLNERMAIVTHYLHNRGTVFANSYEEMALRLMDDLYNWKISKK